MRNFTKLISGTLLMAILLVLSGVSEAQPESGDAAAPYGNRFVETAVVTAPDGKEFDGFGGSVAVQGDTVVIGAPGADLDFEDQGAVYILQREGENWIEKQRLVAGDNKLGDRFGQAVALDGDNLLVTAPSGDFDQDGTYVFERSGGIWHEQQKLVTSDDGYNPGGTVALSGSTALLSNPTRTSVSIFVEDAGTWVEQQVLTLSDGEGGVYFGEYIAVSGDTAAISSGSCCYPRTALGDNYVDIFTRSAGKWSRQQTLTNWDGTDIADGPNFALDEDTLFTFYPGVIYIFDRVGVAWSLSQKIFESDEPFYVSSGYGIALDGDTAIIHAGFYQDGSGYLQQAGYNVFTRSNKVWRLHSRIGDDLEGYGGYGRSLALDGDTAVIGTPDGDVSGSEEQGRANIFEWQAFEFGQYLPTIAREWE